MPKLADIDAYELADALGKERSALGNAAKQEGRRTKDTEPRDDLRTTGA